MNNIKTKDKPIMNILAGPNGSGKSSFLAEQMPPNIIKLNADVFSREIVKREYKKKGEIINENEVQAIVDNSLAYQLKGLRHLLKMLQESIEHNKSFVAETTLDVITYKKYMKQAKQQGFEVNLFYTGTNIPIINFY